MTETDLIRAALSEDMPSGDLTTDNLELGTKVGRARLVAKQDLILSGTRLFKTVFETLDRDIEIKWHFLDAEPVLNGQTVATLKGPLSSLLKGERVALNFLGHLSGVASLTRSFVQKVQHTPCKILDTRKTLPGFRVLQKEAVRNGGGLNHRMNLSDAVMIKENHIRAAGGIKAAVEKIRAKTDSPIEVEVSNLAEIKECLGLGIKRLLLDNMDNELTEKALKIIPEGVETEASGNMSLERVRSVAELGVDFISIGALTHSVPVADFSLQFDWDE